MRLLELAKYNIGVLLSVIKQDGLTHFPIHSIYKNRLNFPSNIMDHIISGF